MTQEKPTWTLHDSHGARTRRDRHGLRGARPLHRRGGRGVEDPRSRVVRRAQRETGRGVPAERPLGRAPEAPQYRQVFEPARPAAPRGWRWSWWRARACGKCWTTAPLSIARAIQIFDDVASALAYAHEEGMVHRGVRPSNILVLPRAWRRSAISVSGRSARRRCATCPPSRCAASRSIHRSDLFSLGAVFYEMLTRRAAFEGKSAEQIKQDILHAEPAPPSKVNPHVPGALDRSSSACSPCVPTTASPTPASCCATCSASRKGSGSDPAPAPPPPNPRCGHRLQTDPPTLRRYQLARHSTSARRRS